MKKSYKNILIFFSAVVFSLCFLSFTFPNKKVQPLDTKKISIVNTSSINIDKIFLGSYEKEVWNDDLLENYKDPLLKSGESLKVVVECNTFDALIIDENGNRFFIFSLAICSNQKWEISDDLLLTEKQE
jgi:hypothetical protein